jgi:hypothetical protein
VPSTSDDTPAPFPIPTPLGSGTDPSLEVLVAHRPLNELDHRLAALPGDQGRGQCYRMKEVAEGSRGAMPDITICHSGTLASSCPVGEDSGHSNE